MRRIVKHKEHEQFVEVTAVDLQKIIVLKAKGTFYILGGICPDAQNPSWGFFPLHSQEPELYITERCYDTIKAAFDDGREAIYECDIDDFRKLLLT